MNTQKTKSSPMNFIWGLLLGLILMGALWFFLHENENPKIIVSYTPIDFTEAKQYFENYNTVKPGMDSCRFRSIPFSHNQISTISDILSQKKIEYINLYKGIDNKSDTIIIVVGTNRNGQEDPKIIYSVKKSPSRNSPCPPVCDHDIWE